MGTGTGDRFGRKGGDLQIGPVPFGHQIEDLLGSDLFGVRFGAYQIWPAKLRDKKKSA